MPKYEAPCAVCGATLTLRQRNESPYCKTKSCAEGYALGRGFKDRISRERGHLVWTGTYSPSHHAPILALYYKGPDGERKSLSRSPRFLSWANAGRHLPEKHSLFLNCTEPRCVSPEHMTAMPKIALSGTERPLREPPRPKPTLSATPLLEYVRSRNFAVPSHGDGEADYVWFASLEPDRQLDVFRVDAFCIDVLGVHPYFVYGKAWFDA